jgi:hypothetical protein
LLFPEVFTEALTSSRDLFIVPHKDRYKFDKPKHLFR